MAHLHVRGGPPTAAAVAALLAERLPGATDGPGPPACTVVVAPRPGCLDDDPGAGGPLLLQVGAEEPGLEVAIALHEAALGAGRAAEIEVWDGCGEGWQLDERDPLAAEALDRLVSFARRHLPAAGPEG